MKQALTYSTTRLVTETVAAETLSISPATLRRWRWSGVGPRFIKIGRAVRYDPAELAAFVDAGRRLSTSDRGEAQ